MRDFWKFLIFCHFNHFCIRWGKCGENFWWCEEFVVPLYPEILKLNRYEGNIDYKKGG